MSTRISPLAGQPVPKALLIDVDKLVGGLLFRAEIGV